VRVVPSVLWVDRRVHVGEVAEVVRFQSYVVAGPDEDSCSLWRGAIGTDSYGRKLSTFKRFRSIA
jgi:hypothetical protein